MFYPVESLKKGGRFYMCWVADSWPLRFATITHRQLWSQDIRKVCDDLLEVITIESGRPARRFSLRLSSQLMRGLVRLYQRKVTDVLSELCMINANVSKHVNKKFVFREIVLTEPRPRLPLIVLPEAPENEERVEDIIRRSRNVVANIQDITLREPTLPEQQPLLNDNFGELHPEQALQLDRTLETMLAQTVQDLSAVQHSVGMPAGDSSADRSHDRSADRSRLAPHDSARMERISEHDLTLYRKSVGDELLPIGDIEKEVPEIPEMTALLPPEPSVTVTAPQVMDISEKEKIKEPEISKDIQMEVDEQRPKEPEVIVLEELEEGERQAKRRRMRGKIVDKNIKLSSAFLRARIANNAVELRCEDSIDDVISIRVPSDILLNRPVHAGFKLRSSLGYTLAGLFSRNLGIVNKRPLAERDMEEAMAPRNNRSHLKSVLERIEEETEPAETRAPTVEGPQAEPDVNLSLPAHCLADMSELPTQLIETLSQQRKRTSELDISPTKRPRRCGYVSYRQSQKSVDLVPAYEVDKENIPDNIPVEFQQQNAERDLTSMLQEAGLADLPPQRPTEAQVESPKETQSAQTRTRRALSETSETPLGSLDRTKVSLGDSDKTTDSKRFIRDQWGTEGSMIKILHCIRDGVKPLQVGNLIQRGPLMPGYKNIIAARCFTSILKLKQHGFVTICKDPETLEIRDIMLGPKFDHID